MPYEDGTLIPITGEWLRGASFSTFNEISVLFPPDETETARLVDGWNFDAERLWLSQRWQHVAWPKEIPFQAEEFIATCRDLGRGGGILALMKLPIGVSWFEVRVHCVLRRLSSCRLLASAVEGLPMKRLSASGPHWPPK